MSAGRGQRLGEARMITDAVEEVLTPRTVDPAAPPRSLATEAVEELKDRMDASDEKLAAAEEVGRKKGRAEVVEELLDWADIEAKSSTRIAIIWIHRKLDQMKAAGRLKS